MAFAADEGAIHVDLSHAGIVEPILTLAALDVLSIGVGGHQAETGLLPALRRWFQSLALLVENGPREVVVVV